MLSVAKLKHFFENVKRSIDKEGDAAKFSQDFNQNDKEALKDFSDIFNQSQNEGPLTRARAKLIKYKDTAQLALLLLKSETDTVNSLCLPSEHCGRCESQKSYLKNINSLPAQ